MADADPTDEFTANADGGGDGPVVDNYRPVKKWLPELSPPVCPKGCFKFDGRMRHSATRNCRCSGSSLELPPWMRMGTARGRNRSSPDRPAICSVVAFYTLEHDAPTRRDDGTQMTAWYEQPDRVNGCPAFLSDNGTRSIVRGRDVWWLQLCSEAVDVDHRKLLFMPAPPEATKLPPADGEWYLGPGCPALDMRELLCPYCGALEGPDSCSLLVRGTCPARCKSSLNRTRGVTFKNALADAAAANRQHNTIRVGDLGPRISIRYNPVYVMKRAAVVPNRWAHPNSPITREQRLAFRDLLMVGLRLAYGSSTMGYFISLDAWWVVLACLAGPDLVVKCTAQPPPISCGPGETRQDGSRVRGHVVCSDCGRRYVVRYQYSGRRPRCRSCRKALVPGVLP
mmetsp:Transcript_36607/g.95866  ORF Transcript_36607/g.95866 Transcript_36607/m.95866 type:complete len:397 (-) Transcript_36607:112-1302(-)